MSHARLYVAAVLWRGRSDVARDRVDTAPSGEATSTNVTGNGPSAVSVRAKADGHASAPDVIAAETKAFGARLPFRAYRASHATNAACA